jgi:hypothetical protein
MRTTINHAIDILDRHDQEGGQDQTEELIRVIRRVQSDYLEIIENALSLLIQDREDECMQYLREEREKLENAKARISQLIADESRWDNEFHRIAIEYLFSRARLVDEIRLFPNFALQLLERMTLDQTLNETITYLEKAMTGKTDLFANILKHSSS